MSKLFPHHLQQLRQSGLNDATIASAGLYSEANADKIRSLIKCSARDAKKMGACMVFPFHDLDGRNGYARIRPDNPRVMGSRKLKYESPKGEPNQPYIPPSVIQYLDRPVELILTEGEKKALAANQAGFPAIGLVGVFGWKKKDESTLLPTLDRIEWTKRRVYIAFDSDIDKNTNVQQAEKWLCHHLKNRGADVKVIRFSHGEDGSKVGLDDYLLTNGPDKLRKLCENALDPSEIEGEVAKFHSKLADPAIEATSLITHVTTDGYSKLRYWSGSFWWWGGGRYFEVPTSEVRAMIVNHLNANYSMVGTKCKNPWKTKGFNG